MASTHKRNTDPMHQATRCGAKTRAGSPCQAPAIKGARRCRMHGGKGSGAPTGNRNAEKRGRYNREAKARKRKVRALLNEAKRIRMLLQ